MRDQLEVFDFIYVDAPRIKSLYTQLNEDVPVGDLTASDAIESVKESDNVATLGSDHLIGGKRTKKRLSKTVETIQKTYEVQFALPVDFLAMLNEHDLIQRDTSQFQFGSLVEFSGDIFLMDYASIHSGWDALLEAGQDNKNNQVSKADLAIAKSIFGSMPPSVQAVFYNGTNKVWSMLVMDHWVIPPQSITLSLGSMVKGDWRIVGVVDALPIDKPSKDLLPPVLTKFSIGFAALGLRIRALMGRRDDCFGITPILVYRTVTRKKKETARSR